MPITPACVADKKLAREITKLAVRALYFEVKAYPKPGLVSFVCQGAHDDMDGKLFYRSLFSLRHYFYKIIYVSIESIDFNYVVKLAKQAEMRMLEVTEGVNTHRGAIFALGIMVISTARLIARQKICQPDMLQQQILDDWYDHLQGHKNQPNSHGSQVNKQYQITDAKAMASQAYPIIFQLLPSFLAMYDKTLSLDMSCLYAYAELLCHVDDTNILYRKQWNGLMYARNYAKEILMLNSMEERYNYAIYVHHLFSSEKISPGGVGDLIAVLLFAGQLFHERLRCHYS